MKILGTIFSALALFVYSAHAELAEPKTDLSGLNSLFNTVSGFSFTSQGSAAFNDKEWTLNSANGKAEYYSDQAKQKTVIKTYANSVRVNHWSGDVLINGFSAHYENGKLISATQCRTNDMCFTADNAICKALMQRVGASDSADLDNHLRKCSDSLDLMQSGGIKAASKKAMGEEQRNIKELNSVALKTRGTADSFASSKDLFETIGSSGTVASLYLQTMSKLCGPSFHYASASPQGGDADDKTH